MSQNFVLVTGAASGIGQQIAIQLSAVKNIVLIDKNIQGLQQTVQKCSKHTIQLVFECDLEQTEKIKESLSEFITQNQIGIECFIHCAGIMKVMHMKNVDYQNAIQIFNVNFFSATEIVSTLLKKKVNGQNLKNIVFISAILSKFGARGHNLYSATKAALDGLMRSLALELSPEIRVNSILPGAIKTPMSELAYQNPEILAKMQNDYPLGTGKPEDIANLVEFIISEKANWITGQQIIVDGGRTINFSQK